MKIILTIFICISIAFVVTVAQLVVFGETILAVSLGAGLLAGLYLSDKLGLNI